MMFKVCFLFVFFYVTVVQGEPQLVIRQHYNDKKFLVVSSITVIEGDNFFLKCQLMDNEKRLDGEAIWSKQTSESDIVLMYNYLHFTSVSQDDKGIYLCKNSEHNLCRAISLKVMSRLSIPSCNNFNLDKLNNVFADDGPSSNDSNSNSNREPQLVITELYNGNTALVVSHVKVIEGYSIMLKCVVMTNGKQLDIETTWGKETFMSDIRLASTDLQLTSVSTDDEGIYFCENSKYNLHKIISLKVKSGLLMSSYNLNLDKVNNDQPSSSDLNFNHRQKREWSATGPVRDFGDPKDKKGSVTDEINWLEIVTYVIYGIIVVIVLYLLIKYDLTRPCMRRIISGRDWLLKTLFPINEEPADREETTHTTTHSTEETPLHTIHEPPPRYTPVPRTSSAASSPTSPGSTISIGGSSPLPVKQPISPSSPIAGPSVASPQSVSPKLPAPLKLPAPSSSPILEPSVPSPSSALSNPSPTSVAVPSPDSVQPTSSSSFIPAPSVSVLADPIPTSFSSTFPGPSASLSVPSPDAVQVPTSSSLPIIKPSTPSSVSSPDSVQPTSSSSSIPAPSASVLPDPIPTSFSSTFPGPSASLSVLSPDAVPTSSSLPIIKPSTPSSVSSPDSVQQSTTSSSPSPFPSSDPGQLPTSSSSPFPFPSSDPVKLLTSESTPALKISISRSGDHSVSHSPISPTNVAATDDGNQQNDNGNGDDNITVTKTDVRYVK